MRLIPPEGQRELPVFVFAFLAFSGLFFVFLDVSHKIYLNSLIEGVVFKYSRVMT
jgi:hypothetical protein